MFLVGFVPKCGFVYLTFQSMKRVLFASFKKRKNRYIIEGFLYVQQTI
jgi:hypothetical protein